VETDETRFLRTSRGTRDSPPPAAAAAAPSVEARSSRSLFRLLASSFAFRCRGAPLARGAPAASFRDYTLEIVNRMRPRADIPYISGDLFSSVSARGTEGAAGK